MLKKMIILVVLLGMVSIAQAQKSLGELASSAGVEWLVGQWQGETDNGNPIALEFKADLDQHIGFVFFKDQRSESKGIVIVDPESGEPKYFAGNNLGGFGTGVWSAEDNKAILKYKHTDAEGKVTRFGLIFSKSGADGMDVKVYELSTDNKLGDEARYTIKMKRKK